MPLSRLKSLKSALRGHAHAISVKLKPGKHYDIPQAGSSCVPPKIAYKRRLRWFQPGAERMAAKAVGHRARHPVSPPSGIFEPFPRLGGLGAEAAIEKERSIECRSMSTYFLRVRM
jgi:hypothetical protein